MSLNFATEDKSELKAWAKNNLDLGLTMNMSAETMRDHILAKCKELQIEPPVAKIIIKQDKAKKNAKTVVIRIAKTKEAGGNEPQFVGVQAVGYYIPRGIDVAVSPGIVEALKNAVADNVTQDDGSGALLHDDVQRVPFTVVREAA